MHPLTNDLTKLSQEELNDKFLAISKRINIAYRLGYGDALYQLRAILEDYQNEINRRNQIAMEEMLKKSEKFNGIIDIK